MTPSERPGPSDVERDYPGLKPAIQDASTIAKKNFRNYGIEAVRPPVVLYETSHFQRIVQGENQRSNSRAVVQFNGVDGVTYANTDEIRTLLDKGKEGIRHITKAFTQSNIHALATEQGANSVRVGYATFPIEPNPHRLIPGKIYEDEHLGGKDILSGPFPIPTNDLRLTDHVTELLLHYMISDLRTDLQEEYPYFLLEKLFSNDAYPKEPKGFDILTRSLIEGDPEPLIYFGKGFLKMLGSRYVRITSIPTPPIVGGQRLSL